MSSALLTGAGKCAAASAFSPSNQASTLLWFSSSYGVRKSGGDPASNNEVCVQWDAKKGGVSLANAVNGPTFKTNILNGFPALYFSGRTAFKWLALSGLNIDQPLSFMIVGRRDGNQLYDGGAHSSDYYFDDVDGASRIALLTSANDLKTHEAYAGSSFTDAGNYLGEWETVTLKAAGALSTLRHNGVQNGTGDIGANNLRSLIVGDRTGGNSNGLEGYMLDFLVGTWNDAERDQDEAYFRGLYEHYEEA